MKLTQLIVLRGFLKPLYCFLLFLFIAFPALAQNSEQDTRLGTALMLDLEKKLIRNLTAAFEGEVRLVNNQVGFDRTSATIGLDYKFFNQKAKIGGAYAFIHLYNNDFLFESRHRYYLNLTYKESIKAFTVSWRGRLQGTYRNENRDRYKINPKYVMKNKVEASYSIFGSPWTPYLSCDFSTVLNDPMLNGYGLTRLRFTGGTSWRINRNNYLDLFLRYDRELDRRDPNTISLGIGYKINIL